jgi:hypothetical protein
MGSYQEPPGGDFVAYIDELQRQSAARVRAQGGSTVDAHTPHKFEPLAAETQTTSAPPVLTRQQAEELLARLARRGAAVGSRSGQFAVVLGIALLILWFATRAGTLTFLIGLGLLVWGLVQQARAARAKQPTAADRLKQLFHPTAPPR